MLYTSTIAEQVAGYLLDVEAIKLSPTEPFTWSSGWKSPIYCDNRISLSNVEARTFIKEKLAEMIKDKFGDFDGISGVATAGIPQGALVADFLGVPFSYVRPKPKAHGLGNQIEGKVESGQRLVVIEDLISTGGSSLKALEPLQQAGCEIVGVAAIFTYGLPVADDNFNNAGVTLYTLSDYQSLLPIAMQRGLINTEQVELLENWRKDPEIWGK